MINKTRFYTLLTTAIVVAFAAHAQAQDVELLSKGAVWSYLDDGSDQGTAWRESAFEDSLWATGAAELGYGENNETTVVSFGGDPNNKHITTYFRTSFNVVDPAVFTSLAVNLLRDDGAVIYLNGTEIVTDHIADDPAFDTFADSPHVSGANETTYFETIGIAASLLVVGTNVIAAEVHQQAVNSSDISFDMELIGVNAVPEPSTFMLLVAGGLSCLTSGRRRRRRVA